MRNSRMQDGGNGKKIGTGENGRGRIWRLIYDELVEKDKEEVEEKIGRVSLMAGQDSCTRYSEAKALVRNTPKQRLVYRNTPKLNGPTCYWRSR
jgi:hypothetical protein